MSNILKRKKKKMEPIGYSQQELESMQQYSRRNTMRRNVVQKAYLDIKLVSFLILHDKFGWGIKRLSRLEGAINKCLEENAKRNMHAFDYEEYLKVKCKICVTDEINKIPSREKILFVYDRIPADPATASDTAQLVSAAIYNHIALSCTILKEQFKFSSKQLLAFIYWCQYYINSIALWSQSSGKRGECIKCIAQVMADECGYYDQRYNACKSVR